MGAIWEASKIFYFSILYTVLLPLIGLFYIRHIKSDDQKLYFIVISFLGLIQLSILLIQGNDLWLSNAGMPVAFVMWTVLLSMWMHNTYLKRMALITGLLGIILWLALRSWQPNYFTTEIDSLSFGVQSILLAMVSFFTIMPMGNNKLSVVKKTNYKLLKDYRLWASMGVLTYSLLTIPYFSIVNMVIGSDFYLMAVNVNAIAMIVVSIFYSMGFICMQFQNN